MICIGIGNATLHEINNRKLIPKMKLFIGPVVGNEAFT